MNIPLPTEFNQPLRLLSLLKEYPESFWIQKGEHRVLTLFHQMANHVPAYKDFLRKHHLDPDKIKTISDFKNVPTVDKDNYLREYSLESLCWDGDLKGRQMTIAATSGSTGEPFYFPREKLQDHQYSLTAELYLVNNFAIDKKSTLYINGFGREKRKTAASRSRIGRGPFWRRKEICGQNLFRRHDLFLEFRRRIALQSSALSSD